MFKKEGFYKTNLALVREVSIYYFGSLVTLWNKMWKNLKKTLDDLMVHSGI